MSPDLRRRMCPAGRPATRVIAGLCCVALFGLALTGCGSGGAAHAPSHSASASRGARIVSAAPVRGRVQDIVVDSPAVKEQVKVRLLLPMRFSKDRTRHWPVLYLLHGCCDTYVSWNRSTDIEPLTRNLDVLVVMPDGGTVGLYSDWLSGPGWETFHTQELPALLATAYRASGRAVIGGVSMGGLGALDYAARHPGMFTVAASFSGVVHTRLSPEVKQDYLGLIQSRGEDPLGLWGDPNSDVDVWRAHNPYDLATPPEECSAVHFRRQRPARPTGRPAHRTGSDRDLHRSAEPRIRPEGPHPRPTRHHRPIRTRHPQLGVLAARTASRLAAHPLRPRPALEPVETMQPDTDVATAATGDGASRAGPSA
jgi:S-formylglutathione hydrolase FrmB